MKGHISGFSLVELLLGLALSGLLAAAILQLSTNGFQLLSSLNFGESQRNLENYFASSLLRRDYLDKSATDVLNGALGRCLDADPIAGNDCTTTASQPVPFRLLDATGKVLTRNPSYYNLAGKECPFSGRFCPFAVTTRFRARCSGGASSCRQAESVALFYEITTTINISHQVSHLTNPVTNFGPPGNEISHDLAQIATLKPLVCTHAYKQAGQAPVVLEGSPNAIGADTGTRWTRPSIWCEAPYKRMGCHISLPLTGTQHTEAANELASSFRVISGPFPVFSNTQTIYGYTLNVHQYTDWDINEDTPNACSSDDEETVFLAKISIICCTGVN